ncbi:MAG: hypothetical protein WCF04_08710 [Candidatus Nanopelagicales bacterium]
MLILVEVLQPFFAMTALLAVALLLVLAGGWLDRTTSSTPEEALEDLRRYGPAASGLRVELLPEDQRWAVEAARAARGRTDWMGRRIA